MATAAAAPKTRWAREYETIYILRPDVDNETAEKIAGRAGDVVQRLGGTLTKLDNWGRRRLAYPIEKNTRGVFIYLKYVGFGDLVAELERNLRLLDEVVRFQTVLLRKDIDPSTVQVDPEEVQYLHVEDEDEPEDAETERARSLGMIPRAPRPDRPEAHAPPESAQRPPSAAAAEEAQSATETAKEAAEEPTAEETAKEPTAEEAAEEPVTEDASDAADDDDDKPKGGA